jgi:hypothetical protein
MPHHDHVLNFVYYYVYNMYNSRRSFITGSLTSSDSSAHFAGNGRSRFTFLFGVLQVGIGHLEKRFQHLQETIIKML